MTFRSSSVSWRVMVRPPQPLLSNASFSMMICEIRGYRSRLMYGILSMRFSGCRSEERRVGKEWGNRELRRHTRWPRDWSSDVCSSDLIVRVRHFMKRPENDVQELERFLARNGAASPAFIE